MVKIALFFSNGHFEHEASPFFHYRFIMRAQFVLCHAYVFSAYIFQFKCTYMYECSCNVQKHVIMQYQFNCNFFVPIKATILANKLYDLGL